ncbi:unnamed protein product [Trichobilharzia szidati]|nr:unnamed protein product [Trichobilharzia szidati]
MMSHNYPQNPVSYSMINACLQSNLLHYSPLSDIRRALEEVNNKTNQYEELSQSTLFTIGGLLSSASSIQRRISQQLDDQDMQVQTYVRCEMQHYSKINQPGMYKRVIAAIENLTRRFGVLRRKYTTNVDQYKALLRQLEDEIRNGERNVSSAVTQPSTNEQAPIRHECRYSVISRRQSSEAPIRHECRYSVISRRQSSGTAYNLSNIQHNTTVNPDTTTAEPTTTATTQVIIELFQEMSQYLLSKIVY